MIDSADYKKWLGRARQDMKMLELIYNEGLEGMADSFCYICHQAIEKLLKAYIIKYEKMAPKSHDLLFLLGKCIRFNNQLIELTDPLMVLNEYAVSARYPDDFDDQRTVEDAKEAYGYALEVEKELMLRF